MKIVHTSDWHLGKTLEGVSRIQEQQMFIDDFDVDLVIVAGDIYDTTNPPAVAEKMFYKALKNISKNGERIVLIISGNHDNPERLAAANPLAYEQGIILVAKPKSKVPIGNCGKHKIIDSGEGYLELEINNEKTVIITMPYPSEKRLDEVIYEDFEEQEMQRSYSERLGQLFNSLSEKFREDTINLAVSHLYVIGGEESTSERNIQLGGSLAVYSKDLPLKAQYIALGHLHKPQEIKNRGSRIVYSGSPLQYSKSEIGYSKSCCIINACAEKEVQVNKIFFKNYKPLEIWHCKSVDEAIEKCTENKERNVWVYIEIETDSYITQENIKTIKSIKKDILEIKPIIKSNQVDDEEVQDIKEKSIEDLFKAFYLKEREVEPQDELMDLFLRIVEGCDEI